MIIYLVYEYYEYEGDCVDENDTKAFIDLIDAEQYCAKKNAKARYSDWCVTPVELLYEVSHV